MDMEVRCCKCELFVCVRHSVKSVSCIECPYAPTACDEDV